MNKNIKILGSLIVVIIIGVFVYIQTLDSQRNAQSIQNTIVTDQKSTEQSPIAYEIINGITVPPEPDPELNNATLAGIDMNGNGVRDDVERLIAEMYGNYPVKYIQALAFSKAEQATVVVGNQLSSDVYGKAVDCSTMTADELDPITFALLNTEERGRAYALTNAGSSGGARDDCDGWEEEILY